jgi:DNA sulfur modification protein DndD
MKIIAISFHDYRVYAGRQTINLAPPKSGKPVVLIGGMNGEGKTTLLEGLQVAMFGRQSELWQQSGASYPEYLRQSIHRGADPRAGAMVEVEFEAVDGGRMSTFKVQRSWKVTGSDKVVEYVQVFLNGALDKLLSDEWPEQVERFMPARLAGLFFFDGEKIKHYADPQRARELVELGICALLGIDLIDQLALDLKAMEMRIAKSARVAGDRPELIRLDARVSELELEKKQFKDLHASLSTHQDALSNALADAERRFRAQGGEVYERRQELYQHERELRRDQDETVRALLGAAGGVLPLALAMDLVCETLDQSCREVAAADAKASLRAAGSLQTRLLQHLRQSGAPEKTSRLVQEFLVDEASKLLPGAEIPMWLRMSDEDAAMLDRLVRTDLGDARAAASDSIKGYDAIDAKLTALNRRLATVPDADAIAQLQDDVEAARRECVLNEGRIVQVAESLRSQSIQIADAKANLSQLVMKALESSDESAEDRRVLDHAEKARNTLAQFRVRLIRQRLEALEEATTESYALLMRKTALVQKITIDPETYALHLYNRDGREIAPEWLSAGERQLLVVAILWGLARASGRSIPVIVDTPLGRLDSEHRDNLVRAYFPNASHQVILLSTDEEIVGQRLTALDPFIGHKYRLVYDEKLDTTQIQSGYFQEASDAN